MRKGNGVVLQHVNMPLIDYAYIVLFINTSIIFEILSLVKLKLLCGQTRRCPSSSSYGVLNDVIYLPFAVFPQRITNRFNLCSLPLVDANL